MFSVFKNKGRGKLTGIAGETVASKAAHDLRSPISVIMGFLEYKNGNVVSSEEENQYLAAMRKSVEKLNRIADTLAAAGCENGEIPKKKPETIIPATYVVPTQKGSTAQCLVVDDDDGLRMQWLIILKKRGYTVIEARSGEELLNMQIDFDAVHTAIVDYHYEGSDLNGLDVLEYLKRKNVKRIHLCTANYQDKEIVRQAKILGVASVIAKPIHLRSLETILS